MKYYPTIVHKQRAKDVFSIIGNEHTKPITKPLVIGNDIRIGKRSVLLKGSKLEDSAITMIKPYMSNQNHIAVGNPTKLPR